MTDFSKNELIVLQVALDTMVRTEGNAMAQAGINGLKGGAASLLATRFDAAVTALDKINVALTAINDAEAAEKPN